MFTKCFLIVLSFFVYFPIFGETNTNSGNISEIVANNSQKSQETYNHILDNISNWANKGVDFVSEQTPIVC